MADTLLALMRAAHGLAAALWLGVSVVGVLSPAALASARAGGLSLRALGRVSLGALVVTGAVLMLDRLADPAIGTLYVALLGLKLALVGAMGLVALALPAPAAGNPAALAGSGGRLARWAALGRERLLLALGLGAFVLGSLLTSVYESLSRA